MQVVQVSTRRLDRQGVDGGDRGSGRGGDYVGTGNHKSDNKIFLKLFRGGWQAQKTRLGAGLWD